MSPWLEWPLAAITFAIAWALLTAAARFARDAVRKTLAGARASGSQLPPGTKLPPSKPPMSLPPRGPGPTRPPQHQRGPVTNTIRVWSCGCTHTWDGTGRLTFVLACRPPRTLDDELKDLTQP